MRDRERKSERERKCGKREVLRTIERVRESKSLTLKVLQRVRERD